MPGHQITRKVNGIDTEILVQDFADRILVLVTQIGKVGNLIQARIPDTTPLLPASAPHPSEPNVQPLPPPPTAIELTPLLGTAISEHMQTLHSLYAAQIATLVWVAESQGPIEVSRKSVIVGIALRKSDGDVDNGGLSIGERGSFLETMSLLQELLVSP